MELTTETSKPLKSLWIRVVDLAAQIPNEFVKVSESGISQVEAIQDLKNYGYQGFLVGENFMKTNDPGAAAQNFIQTLEA